MYFIFLLLLFTANAELNGKQPRAKRAVDCPSHALHGGFERFVSGKINRDII